MKNVTTTRLIIYSVITIFFMLFIGIKIGNIRDDIEDLRQEMNDQHNLIIYYGELNK